MSTTTSTKAKAVTKRHKWEKSGRHVKWCLTCGLFEQNGNSGHGEWYKFWTVAGGPSRQFCSADGDAMPMCTPTDCSQSVVEHYQDQQRLQIAQQDAENTWQLRRKTVIYRDPANPADMADLDECMERLRTAAEDYIEATRQYTGLKEEQAERLRQGDEQLAQEFITRAERYGYVRP